MSFKRNIVTLAFVLIFMSASVASAQTTSFTYNGRLLDGGNPANGNYDFQFALFDNSSAGAQVGSTLTLSSVAVAAGVYAVTLDFGGANVFSGANRFLEISVRPSGGGLFTILSPRQQITSTPYAIRALVATTANGVDDGAITNPKLFDGAVTTAKIRDGAVTSAKITPPLALSGADATAILSATNNQPGIGNPSASNIPPAAIRGETTSVPNSTAGVIGISAGNNRAVGVIGVATGVPSGGDVAGVLGIATSTTGNAKGVSAIISSPDGIAVNATSTGGRLFVGNVGPTGSETEVFSVDSAGGVLSQGNVVVAGLLRGGDMKSDTNIRAPNGNVSAGLGLHIANGTFDVNQGTVNVGGSMSVMGSFSVNGAKSSVAHLPDGRSVLLYAEESPENWFEDFGTVRLRNGRAWINIEKTFAQTVNTETNYHVFLTPNGNCRGLYVSRKTSIGFEVRELGRGQSNIGFDYRIVARRKGYENVRLADAPSLPNARLMSSGNPK